MKNHYSQLILPLSRSLFFCFLVCFPGCAKRDVEAERRAAVAETFAMLRSCAPDKSFEDAGNAKFAIASVKLESNETNVRLVGYSLKEAVEFYLPVYYLSRGRWLIDEKERAYLVDEQCREYKLKDRKSPEGQEVSPDGKIRLEPGEVFEVTLSFPRLPDRTQMGLLVYGNRAMPFWLWDEKR
jgi:hypothetical protein